MRDPSNLEYPRSQQPSRAGFQGEPAFNSPAEIPSGGLLEYWRILQRRRTAILAAAFLGMCVAFLYTIPQKHLYQAQAVIEIQSFNEDFLNMKDFDPSSNASGWDPTIELLTQVRILQSSALLGRVARKVEAQTSALNLPPGRASVWRKLLHLPQKTAAETTAANINAAAANLRIRVEPNTRLIEILSSSPDPNIAAAFANTLASEFIEQSLEARWETTQHTGEFLGNQMQDLKTKLEQSEDAMQAYARDANLVITDEKDNAEDQRLTQLQDELSKAQAERIERQSRFELANRAPVASLGEILDDNSLRDTEARLADLRRQYAELDAVLLPADDREKKVQAQIAALELAQQQERADIIGRIRNDFEAAQRREDLLSADYANTAKMDAAEADKVTHYNTLKREVDSNRQLYDSLLQRVKEASVASALRASNIHVVDPAVAPRAPYSPNIFSNTMIGLFAGVICGIAFVIFMERADRTIQEPGDTSFYIGVPELGVVPSASVDAARGHWQPSLKGQPTRGSIRETALTTLENKPTALAESFRSTLTSIMFSGENGVHPQVLVISSGSPKEGKTTLATNLAVALAEIHKRVLLIDGDLRRPSIHRFFNLSKDTGMADLLRRGEPIDGPLNGHVSPSGVPNLSVMTSGTSVIGDPTLLHSNRLTELIASVRRDYDLILIDTPPMLSMSDARIIARQSDGVILVVRANVSSRDSIKDAHRRFVEDGARVIGTVLNDWNPRKSSRYSYNRLYDRWRHYYAE